MLALFKELGLKSERTDERAQIVITRWQNFDDKKFKSLGHPSLSTPYRARRFQVHAFVSPFVEPGRVYLGSIVDADNVGSAIMSSHGPQPPYGGRLYNLEHVEKWVLEGLAERLGTSGEAIPRQVHERAALVTKLLGIPPSEPCPGRPKAVDRVGSERPGEAIKPPTRLVEIRPVYPGPELAAGKQAVVILETLIWEDGSVWDAQVIKSQEPAGQFGTAAKHAVSLWRFSPLVMKNCPVPTSMTVAVNFALR